MTKSFSRAEAERLLGPAVMEAVRREVDAAPPLRPELREQLRALFASARAMRLATPRHTEGDEVQDPQSDSDAR